MNIEPRSSGEIENSKIVDFAQAKERLEKRKESVETPGPEASEFESRKEQQKAEVLQSVARIKEQMTALEERVFERLKRLDPATADGYRTDRQNQYKVVEEYRLGLIDAIINTSTSQEMEEILATSRQFMEETQTCLEKEEQQVFGVTDKLLESMPETLRNEVLYQRNESEKFITGLEQRITVSRNKLEGLAGKIRGDRLDRAQGWLDNASKLIEKTMGLPDLQRLQNKQQLENLVSQIEVIINRWG